MSLEELVPQSEGLPPELMRPLQHVVFSAQGDSSFWLIEVVSSVSVACRLPGMTLVYKYSYFYELNAHSLPQPTCSSCSCQLWHTRSFFHWQCQFCGIDVKSKSPMKMFIEAYRRSGQLKNTNIQLGIWCVLKAAPFVSYVNQHTTSSLAHDCPTGQCCWWCAFSSRH